MHCGTFTCKIQFFVMYFLFVFGEMLPPLLTEANRWNCGLTETWSLCCFSPTSQQCLTCRQCPIGIFGTCFLSKDVTCTNTNQSCFRGDARKETFFSSIVKVFRQRKLRTEETHKEKQKYFPSLFEWLRLIEQNQIFQVRLLH